MFVHLADWFNYHLACVYKYFFKGKITTTDKLITLVLQDGNYRSVQDL